MSFLRRIGSTKKRGSYRVSTGSAPVECARDRPRSQALSETAASRSPGVIIHCHVTLLTDAVFSCDMTKHSLGSTLMDEVYRHVDLLERDYFGLAYSDSGLMRWLDPEKPLKKQFKSGVTSVVLELRVRFYASDPSNLQEELTRYLYFNQIKKDLLEGRLKCPLEAAAVLSAFAVQAELGDYDPANHPPGYVSELRFIPRQTEDFEERVAELHQELRGQTSAEAEYSFLQYARQLDFYGMEQYSAQDQLGITISLGVCAQGIVISREMKKLNTFSWPNVLKITHSRKKFFIELRPTVENGDGFGEHVIGFHMESAEAGKRLWKACIEQHAFFRMAEIKNLTRNGVLRRSRVRIMRRTERQAVEANKAMARERQVGGGSKLQRTPSKRYPRRTPLAVSDDMEDIAFRRRANTEIGGRSMSFRDRSRTAAVGDMQRVQSPVEGMRPSRHSQREITPNLSSPRSPSLLDDDCADVTSHFVLDKTEETGLISLSYTTGPNFFVADEPTEYYDEVNAAEELAGQMTVDDLASDGLLLVRLTPDSEGRFGFHVKGGADLNLPVFISKVKEDSPASQCQPPLEEGDQVVYINGIPTADASHTRVILAIKSSLEKQPAQLVLIIKPKDLSRVDPTSQMPVVESSSTDPATLLRESMTQLKENVLNSSALLLFDRLYRKKPGMLTIASKLPQNLSKNRFRDITAYDVTRVHLLDGPVDYINANYVNMEIAMTGNTGQVNRYIATQGPMQNTCIDFWQMVWEQDCSLIVMLTETVDKKKVVCCRYWPDKGLSTEYGQFEIHCQSERNDNISTTRTFTIKNHRTKESKEVTHLQYIDWPEHNIPRTKADFLRFVRRLHVHKANMEDPVVVHCSAGVGRTGVLIAMETALTKMEAVEPVYPLEIVRGMRDQRGMMLPALNQFKFVCECIIEAYEEDYLEIELPNRATVATIAPPIK